LIKNKYSPVEKKTLKRIDIEKIFKTTFKEKDPLYNVKNYFLFQIFAQGMRVSDLLTLRWGNLKDGEINFYQLKTKTQHRIPFNDVVVLKIADYLPNRGLDVINSKFNFDVLDKKYSLTFKEIEENYESIRKGNIKRVIEGDEKFIKELEMWIEVLNNCKYAMITDLIIQIVGHSKSNLKKFIFPILDDEVFKDVDFTSEKYTLSKYQFNQMSSKTTVYNKYLKKLQEKCEIDIVLTSHLARHSYTSLMIESTDKDIYTISKSLGHANLSTTQHYISEFLDERVHKENDKLNKTFKNIF
jgi:integrase